MSKRKLSESSSSSSDSDLDNSRRRVVTRELSTVLLHTTQSSTVVYKERWHTPDPQRPHFTPLLLQILEQQGDFKWLGMEVSKFVDIQSYLNLGRASKQRYFNVRFVMTNFPPANMLMVTRQLILEKIEVSVRYGVGLCYCFVARG